MGADGGNYNSGAAWCERPSERGKTRGENAGGLADEVINNDTIERLSGTYAQKFAPCRQCGGFVLAHRPQIDDEPATAGPVRHESRKYGLPDTVRAMEPHKGLTPHVSQQLVDRGRTNRAGGDGFELRDENVLRGRGIGHGLGELAGEPSARSSGFEHLLQVESVKLPVGGVGPGSDLEGPLQQKSHRLVGQGDRPAALAEHWAQLVLDLRRKLICRYEFQLPIHAT